MQSFKYGPSSIRSRVDFNAFNTKLYNNFAMLYFPYLTIFRNETMCILLILRLLIYSGGEIFRSFCVEQI